MARNGKLSANQLEAIRLILQGYRAPEVAKMIDVGRRTVDRWRLEDPDFQKRLGEESGKVLSTHVAALHGPLNEPIEYLYRILREPCDKELKVRASSELLKHAIKLQEIRAKAGTPDVEVNIGGAHSAEWIAIRTAIVDALLPYPDARGAVLSALEELDVA